MIGDVLLALAVPLVTLAVAVVVSACWTCDRHRDARRARHRRPGGRGRADDAQVVFR